jgi:hypothetical protein
MAALTFQLDADRTAVLELKLGQYMVGPQGETGAQGDPGPTGTMTPQDQDAITKAVNDSAASATASATSAAASAASAQTGLNTLSTLQGVASDATTATSNNALAAANSATAAAASAAAALASQTAAKTSETNSGNSASAAGASQTAAKTSETNSAASAAAALASQNAAKTSETNAGTSATAAATSAASSALVLLQTQGSIAGGATQNVFNNFVGPYDEYEMVVTGLVAYTDLSQLLVQFSHDNGATFINTQYSYVQMFNSGSTVAVNPQTNQNIIQLWGNVSGIGSGAPWGQINGIIRFYNLAAAGASPARLPYCTFDLGGIGSTGTVTSMKGSGALVALNGQPVNAIKLACSGAGFQGGTMSLYGRKR